MLILMNAMESKPERKQTSNESDFSQSAQMFQPSLFKLLRRRNDLWTNTYLVASGRDFLFRTSKTPDCFNTATVHKVHNITTYTEATLMLLLLGTAGMATFITPSLPV
eukprot:3140496-Rhodomonas_salina.1